MSRKVNWNEHRERFELKFIQRYGNQAKSDLMACRFVIDGNDADYQGASMCLFYMWQGYKLCLSKSQ